MSTILKALRRLEEDNSSNAANVADAFPATDPRAADELRDRILAEESAAQADAAVEHDSSRTKQIVRNAAALLVIGLGVGAYMMSTPIDSDPSVVAATAKPPSVSVPVVQEPHVEKSPVAIASLQPTNDRTATPPIPAPETPARNEASGNGSEEMLAEASAHSPSDSPSDPVPGAVSVPVPAASIVLSPSPATSSPASSAVSASSGTERSVRSAATKSASRSTTAPSDKADEMAFAAVTPTTSSLAATSPRTIATTPKTSRAEPSAPASRPKRTKIAPSPPSVSAPQPATNPEIVSTTGPTINPITASNAKLTEPRPLREPQRSRASSLSGKSQPSRESQPSKESQRSRESQPSRKSRPSKESRTSRQSQLEPLSAEVERLDRRGLPDLRVIRTSWHPNASRRSAKIRLEDTNETLTLREGDAVGGLVIKEISPSAVLFKAGEVEVRRRVGQPGSGD